MFIQGRVEGSAVDEPHHEALSRTRKQNVHVFFARSRIPLPRQPLATIIVARATPVVTATTPVVTATTPVVDLYPPPYYTGGGGSIRTTITRSSRAASAPGDLTARAGSHPQPRMLSSIDSFLHLCQGRSL